MRGRHNLVILVSTDIAAYLSHTSLMTRLSIVSLALRLAPIAKSAREICAERRCGVILLDLLNFSTVVMILEALLLYETV